MNERSGVVNIGIEGMMLASAFVGWFVASVVDQAMPQRAERVFFGVTTPVLSSACSRRSRRASSCPLVHAWLSISLRVDQIISGTIINIVALGVDRLPQPAAEPELAADRRQVRRRSSRRRS